MNSSGSGCSAEFEDKIDPAEATIAQVERRVTQLNERLGVPLDSSADTRGTCECYVSSFHLEFELGIFQFSE